jgi:hypothetical protein
VSANPNIRSSPTASRMTMARGSTMARAALYLGALGVLATGVIHIQQFYGQDYSTVPTIGTLFFLNFVAAVVIVAGLVAPLGRVAGRHADLVRAGFAVAGIGLAVLALVAQVISESSSLFNFTENGYRTAIVLTIIAEAAATVFLVSFLALSGLPARRR